MEILELHMKHFGKFQDYRMEFHPGVNIIYGGNETGKSTIHAFIRAMFFGIERGRGKAGRKDEYQLRQPWENPSYFAGAMRLRYGNKVYRIERNFNKNEKEVRLICETTGEELAMEDGELSAFLSGMSETAFRNTVFLPQAGSATDAGLAEEVQKFMMNFQETGDGNLDVSKALEKLKNQRKKQELKKKQEQELLDEKMDRKQTELDYVKRELERKCRQAERGQEEAGRRKEHFEETEPERMPRNKTEQRQQQEEETKKLSQEREPEEIQWSAGSEKLLGWITFLLTVCGGLACACGIFAEQIGLRLGMLGAGVLFWLLAVRLILQTRKRHAQERKKRRKRKEEGELQFLDSVWTEAQELERQKEREQRKKAQEEQQLNQAFLKKEQQEKTLQIKMLEKELEELYGQREQLYSYDREVEAIDLAMMRIREVSAEIYRESGAAFSQTASQILSGLTEGRYTHLAFDEKMEIRINTPSRLLYLHQVSYGTMNQIYFALRMAAGNLLSGGRPVPILLDESFAMYDDQRLEAALRWLDGCGRQVILFTSQTREKALLDRIRGQRR